MNEKKEYTTILVKKDILKKLKLLKAMTNSKSISEVLDNLLNKVKVENEKIEFIK